MKLPNIQILVEVEDSLIVSPTRATGFDASSSSLYTYLHRVEFIISEILEQAMEIWRSWSVSCVRGKRNVCELLLTG